MLLNADAIRTRTVIQYADKLYYFSFYFLAYWGRVVGPDVGPERKR